MKTSLFRRRLTAWIAACAILMASLAPAISHAMEMQGAGAKASVAGSWIQICSIHGSRFVQLDDGEKISDKAAPSPASKLMHLEHCPYCSLHLDHPALPSASSALPTPSAAMRILPPLFLQARHPLFAWRGPQPRAPPARL